MISRRVYESTSDEAARTTYCATVPYEFARIYFLCRPLAPNNVSACRARLAPLPRIDGESEYLLPPYSVFEIVSVDISPNPTAANPHKIELKVQNDNKYKRPGIDWPDLPLAPWG